MKRVRNYNEAMEQLIAKLQARRFDAHYCASKEEAVALALNMIKPSDVVAYGGSMTFYESGMYEALKKTPCFLLDRDMAKTPEERASVMKKGLTADVFFASVNALDKTGVLYETEGLGNRVASILFGAKKVILLVGKNKIVPDKAVAEARMKEVACPRNAERLNRDTPCRKVGHCVDCLSKECICASRVELRVSFVPNRITVILIDEELGY